MDAGTDHDAVARRLGLPADDPSVQADLRQLAGEQQATRPAKPPMTTAATIGFFMAIFVPFAGFLMGLALTAARDRHGHWVVVTSIAVTLLAAVALLDSL